MLLVYVDCRDEIKDLERLIEEEERLIDALEVDVKVKESEVLFQEEKLVMGEKFMDLLYSDVNKVIESVEGLNGKVLLLVFIDLS